MSTRRPRSVQPATYYELLTVGAWRARIRAKIAYRLQLRQKVARGGTHPRITAANQRACRGSNTLPPRSDTTRKVGTGRASQMPGVVTLRTADSTCKAGQAAEGGYVPGEHSEGVPMSKNRATQFHELVGKCEDVTLFGDFTWRCYCSCGWESKPSENPGRAHGFWARHRTLAGRGYSKHDRGGLRL